MMTEQLDTSLVERQRCATEFCVRLGNSGSETAKFRRLRPDITIKTQRPSPGLSIHNNTTLSSISVVSNAKGWTGFRFPAGAVFFSLRYRIQTGSGAHPASYPVGNGGSFPGGKAAGE
jgi:hypothetical protein